MKIEIIVTQDHINNGRPASPCDCPIALAMKENTGEKWEVCNVLMWKMVDTSENYRLPSEARDFIYLFDRGEEVKPFSFEVEI